MAIQELSAVASDTYVGGNFYMMWWEAGDAAHQCGYLVQDDGSDEEVKVCATSTVPFAVTALQSTLDINTEVVEGVMYEYYSLKAGTVLLIPHDTVEDASVRGTCMISSTAVAGMVEADTTAGMVVGYCMKSYDTDADLYLELIT